MADHTVRPPRGFFKHGKYWWVNKKFNNTRIRVSTYQTTLDRAILWWETRHARAKLLAVCKPPKKSASEARTLYNSAKSRSARNGDEFTITVDDVASLFERSGGRCELTGITFSPERVGLWRRSPFGASLDRIKANAGYTPKNIRLVCVAVNAALGEWGETVFAQMARSYYATKLRHNVEPESVRS